MNTIKIKTGKSYWIAINDPPEAVRFQVNYIKDWGGDLYAYKNPSSKKPIEKLFNTPQEAILDMGKHRKKYPLIPVNL